MIGLEDRRMIARDVEQARKAGARLRLACEIAGIDVRTLQRWKAREGLDKGDRRPTAMRPLQGHALSPQEREKVLAVANEARFAHMPPGAHRPGPGRRGNLHRQRIDLQPSAAGAGPERASRTGQGAA
jgi:hypothetical protein